MKAKRIIYEGPSNVFAKQGSTIGWVIPSASGGFYSSYGAKRTKNFFGVKHATEAEAEAAIRKINANLKKNVEIIGG